MAVRRHWFVVGVAVLLVATACGGPTASTFASAGGDLSVCGGPSHPAASPSASKGASDPDVPLARALLTSFACAHQTDANHWGHRTLVLRPVKANNAHTYAWGLVDPVLSRPACRHWAGGLWSLAVHDHGLLAHARVATATLGQTTGQTPEPIPSISEVILSGPPRAIAALRFRATAWPASCKQLTESMKAPPDAQFSASYGPTPIHEPQPIPLSLPTRDCFAATSTTDLGPGYSVTGWSVRFRLGARYAVQLSMYLPRSYDKSPQATLQALASAAYAKAAAALLVT